MATATGAAESQALARASVAGPIGGRALSAEVSRVLPGLLEEAMVPGAAVAVVEGGQLLWAGQFGVMDARTGAKVNEETVFEAASLSKPVFAYLVLRLADSGIIDLDAPLTTYMRRRYIEGDDRLDRITARHVLSNTSGFPNWRPRNAPLEIHFTPGERFSYSGEGYAYLQEAIENATGKPLEDLAQTLVFEPLGMENSSFIWRSMYERRKATGHNDIGQANVRREPPSADAASTLHTTAADYGRFVAAVLRRERLATESWQDMLSPQVTLDASCMVCVRQPMQRPSPTLAWGLGWGLETATADTTIWHWGDNQDVHAFVVAIPATGQALVVLTNGENGLTVVPPLVQRMLGRTYEPFEWLRVGPTSTPVRRLHRALVQRGPKALQDYAKRRATLPASQLVTEAELTALGHDLVQDGRVDLAIAVFRQNAEDHPANTRHLVHLGGAHLLAGDQSRALATFERLLLIDPANPTGQGMVADLRAATKRHE